VMRSEAAVFPTSQAEEVLATVEEELST
jgi:hypothetical protein